MQVFVFIIFAAIFETLHKWSLSFGGQCMIVKLSIKPPNGPCDMVVAEDRWSLYIGALHGVAEIAHELSNIHWSLKTGAPYTYMRSLL